MSLGVLPCCVATGQNFSICTFEHNGHWQTRHFPISSDCQVWPECWNSSYGKRPGIFGMTDCHVKAKQSSLLNLIMEICPPTNQYHEEELKELPWATSFCIFVFNRFCIISVFESLTASFAFGISIFLDCSSSNIFSGDDMKNWSFSIQWLSDLWQLR